MVEDSNPHWLIERGIGETRCALVDGGDIIEARILLDEQTRAGSVIEARLISAGMGGRNAVAAAKDGSEYLLPRGARGIAEGGAIAIEVTREAIPGAEPWKRPLARLTNLPVGEAPAPAGEALALPAPKDALGALGWNDLIDEARSGIVRFAGGELAVEPTRALTMIDVDGIGDADELAVLGSAAAAKAIRRLDIQGSIGVDLPTGATKESRLRAAAAFDAFLPQPFERTAVNGFGFIQIVRPRAHASLIELAAERAAFEARALLRRAAFEGAGAKTLAAHPVVIAVLENNPSWTDALARQLGGACRLRAEPKLTMSGGHAQKA